MSEFVLNHLDKANLSLNEKGGIITATEIDQQPEVWAKTLNLYYNETKRIEAHFNSAVDEVDEIVFTGAGTSSFIGYSLTGLMFKSYGIPCKVLPTTDIVSFPRNYFSSKLKYLVISFARSGNSPESMAALRLADKFSKKVFHFIITCNKSGYLHGYSSVNPVVSFSLPSQTNDKGLAMTSSYTSMLLTGLLLSQKGSKGQSTIKNQIDLNLSFAKQILSSQINGLRKIAEMDFERAVFLGSGPLLGTAMEAALKLQELTDGKIICKYDSFLGFRHGPKAVVNNKTIIVYFMNNDPQARKYEVDLLATMKENTNPLFQLGVGENLDKLNHFDHVIESWSETTIDSDFQPLSYILPGQILGLLKSIQLGIRPDTPSPNGAISRVVQGVKIYEYPMI